MTVDLRLDPTTLAVARGALTQIAAEMDLALTQSAFSPVITEMEDRGSGLYEPETGDAIVQGPRTLPVFAWTMQFAVKHLIDTLKRRGEVPHEGDVWAFNDPYLGGTHAQDFKLIAPYFHDGELFCWFAVTGHWLDMGGAVPGSFNPSARECYAEGLQIPPVKLWDRGVRRDDVAEFVFANVRVPDVQQRDLAAMATALRVGMGRLTPLLERHGAPRLVACIAALRRAARTQMEACLRDIPDGDYEFEDFIDDNGIDDQPIRVHVRVTVRDATLELDFSGSSPPSVSPFNLAWNTTVSGALIAVKHVFPEVQVNAGCMDPLTFTVPDTTFLCAQRPYPVGGYLECISRVITVVLGALGKVIGDRVPADWFGTALTTIVSGRNWRDEDYVGAFPFAGGLGGNPDSDGLINAAPLFGLARYPVIERTEQRQPVLFRRYEIRSGSGGQGRFRGGDGTRYELEIFRKPATVTVLGDRARFRPFGAAGGSDGHGTTVRFTLAGQESVPERITKAERVAFAPGDRILLESPGGGGHGTPGERDPERVRADVANELIDAATARDVYGLLPEAEA
jgi:N-methylhydantoinase B